MFGRLLSVALTCLTAVGCLSLLAPGLDREVPGHQGKLLAESPGACLGCHTAEAPRVGVAKSPRGASGGTHQPPMVAAWMLEERGGQCLDCHGVDP